MGRGGKNQLGTFWPSKLFLVTDYISKIVELPCWPKKKGYIIRSPRWFYQNYSNLMLKFTLYLPFSLSCLWNAVGQNYMSCSFAFNQGCSASCQCFAGSFVYNSVVCMLHTFILYLQNDLVAFGEPSFGHNTTDANINTEVKPKH